mmetsp:Transcript_94423/g.192192  ORF Transcript_94423/g.192192 Transcript_94423/m.192192 type:complete len:252 (-) Transcript_94423:191-946(-)
MQGKTIDAIAKSVYFGQQGIAFVVLWFAVGIHPYASIGASRPELVPEHLEFDSLVGVVLGFEASNPRTEIGRRELPQIPLQDGTGSPAGAKQVVPPSPTTAIAIVVVFEFDLGYSPSRPVLVPLEFGGREVHWQQPRRRTTVVVRARSTIDIGSTSCQAFVTARRCKPFALVLLSLLSVTGQTNGSTGRVRRRRRHDYLGDRAPRIRPQIVQVDRSRRIRPDGNHTVVFGTGHGGDQTLLAVLRPPGLSQF